MLKTYTKPLIFVFIIVITTSNPNILLFNLNSNDSLAILAPFLNQNASMNSRLLNITSLDMNTEFLPLFNFILASSPIFTQLMPNISIIPQLSWTSPMTTESKRTFMSKLMNSSLLIFYKLMMKNYYLSNEAECR